jgi:hypothetical protein
VASTESHDLCRALALKGARRFSVAGALLDRIGDLWENNRYRFRPGLGVGEFCAPLQDIIERFANAVPRSKACGEK